MAIPKARYLLVQEALLRLIEEKGLKPHDALPSEGDLVFALGVSRSSVREATRSLQAIGVLYARVGSGLYLDDFSFNPLLSKLPYRVITSGSHFLHVLETRAALERGLIAQVAREISPAGLDRLDHITKKMRDRESRGETFLDLDKRFHELLYEDLDNPLVIDLFSVFWTLMERMQPRLPPFRQEETAALHQDIVDALRAPGLFHPVAAMDRHFIDIVTRARLLILTPETR